MFKKKLLYEEVFQSYNPNLFSFRCGVRLLKFFEKRAKELGLKLPEEMESDDQPKSKKRRNKL